MFSDVTHGYCWKAFKGSRKKVRNVNSLFSSHQQGFDSGVGWKILISMSYKVIPVTVRMRISALLSLHYSIWLSSIYLMKYNAPSFPLNSHGTLTLSHKFHAAAFSFMLFTNWICKPSLFTSTQFIKCSQRKDYATAFWRRAWQTTPVFLPAEPHGQRSLVGYSPWGCKESDTTEET